MKKFLVLAIVAMISATGFSKTIDEVFGAFTKASNVQEMALDKGMLAMAKAMGGEEAKALDGIDGMRILNIDKPSADQLAIAKGLLKEEIDGYDVMVDTSEGGESVKIFTQGDGKEINKMLVIAVEDKAATVVFMEGKINPNDADKLMNFGK